MSSRYRLREGLYVLPTPAGAYYAVSGPGDEPPRRLLRALMRGDASAALSQDALIAWTGAEDSETAMDVLYHVQCLAWMEGFDEPQHAPTKALEDVLPQLLAPLSQSGRVLLADAQGFYVAAAGFTHETAEELSAVSADLASLHGRHRGLLSNNLGLNTSAWALVDAAGNSQVGFWPIHVGTHRFVLVIGGVPRLNQPPLTQLIWALSKRYADQDG